MNAHHESLRITWGCVWLFSALAILGTDCSREEEGPASGPYNCLLITLETTRADILGCYGHKPKITPALDRLADEGVLFEQAVCTAPLTLTSHATMMTGLQPPEHGLRVNGDLKLDVKASTLAEILKSKGYQTAAFIASFTLDSRNRLDRGFDVYDDDLSTAYKQTVDDPLTQYRPGSVVAEAALKWLAQRDPAKPFFCWVHFYDPHAPPHAHDELKGTFLEGLATYEAEVAFMDMQVAKLTKLLKEQRLTRKTLVVAVGDHGESYGPPGEPDREMGHGMQLYKTTLHVPLIVSQPGRIGEAQRVDALVSLVDLFATLQTLLEIEPADPRSGRTLAPALFGQAFESEACYSETFNPYDGFRWSPAWSITTDDWKYVRSAKNMLYDRRKDPGEQTNLAEANPDIVQTLERQLSAMEAEMAPHAAGRVESTREDVARLEALGYVGGGEESSTYDALKDQFRTMPDTADMLPILDEYTRLKEKKTELSTDELLRQMRDLANRSPMTPRFWTGLADELGKAGRWDEGVEAAEKVLELKPGDPMVLLRVARFQLANKNAVQAVRYASDAVAIAPGDKEVHEFLAHILRANGDPAGAARHSPERWDATKAEAVRHYDLGVVLSRQGAMADAVRELEQSLTLAPDDALAHMSLATVQERNGALAAAAQHYADAIRLGIENPKALFALGSALAAQGRLDEAVSYLRKYVDVEPKDATARMNLAMALRDQGKAPEAIEQFSEVLRLQPGHVMAHRLIGDLYNGQGNVDKALEHYRAWSQIDPRDANAKKAIAFALGRKGDLAAAVEEFREILSTSPEDAQAWFFLGTALEAQRQTKNAADAYRQALRFGPGHAQPANNLAWILATAPDDQLRNGPEAVELAKLACQSTNYREPGAMDTLAAAYAESGQFDQAVETTRKALELARAAGNQRLIEGLEGRLKLYEAGQPYRSPTEPQASQPTSQPPVP